MIDGKEVVKAWYELNNHQAFRLNPELNYQKPIFIIDPVMETGFGYISDNPSENNKLCYWFEIIVPYIKTDEAMELEHSTDRVGFMHVWELDDGAPSYEEAILLMHKKFTDKYGEFEEE